MCFYDEMKGYPWDSVESEIMNRSRDDVEKALTSSSMNLDGLMSLVSPAAEPYLEEMAQRAHQVTQQRFGRVISLFAPLYLSNECTNSCVYCGFNMTNRIDRLTLTAEEALVEARAIRRLGFQHILLVSGEAPHLVTLPYLTSVVDLLRPLFPSISIEIYPMDTSSYEELIKHGVDGLIVYQESYNEDVYKQCHPRGRKSDFHWRLETPDRGGNAGFRRIGLGALLGLANWRVEAFFLALHAQYLLRHFWKSFITISFPRLRPAAGAFEPPCPVSDVQFVQLLAALRLLFPDAGLILSTRESPYLRDHLIPLGITSMSAGSRTEPGGYAHETHAEAQFAVADERPPEIVAEVIRSKGYEAVWKDWDAAFLH